MMYKIFALVLIVFSLPSLDAPKTSPGQNKASMKKAIELMTKADMELNKLNKLAAHALWRWKVNITEENLKEKEASTKKVIEYSRKIYHAAQEFPWKSFKEKNATLYRWFELASKGLGFIDPTGLHEGKEGDTNPYSKMSEIYNKAKVCPPGESTGKCNEDAFKAFSETNDPKELKHYWLEFRKETGDKIKNLFIKGVKKDNENAKKFGYKNKAKSNLALYEDKDFVKNIAQEMKKFLPFYIQIHTYVRKKLKKYHKNENIRRDGPIPAHLLGEMHAQRWSKIFDIVKPYPGSSGLPNVTKAMIAKKMKELDLYMLAEKFFTSLGMPKMTPRFWHYSLIQKPSDREVDCHGSAHNFYDGKDFRIKMCTKVSSGYLEVVHHEMGHIEYFMLYNHLPFLFRDSANPGFHEAVGDSISLSVLTPKYLEQIGLLKKNQIQDKKKFTINYLMQMALQYAVTVPYDYVIDYWRNKVYEGTIKDTEYNKKYWQYRMQYQGLCPPSRRTEKNFDIGAKWHIANGVDYWRYYVANIMQFQIHKILCKEAGHEGPLHECNIYKNEKAGKAFVKLLSQGRSKNWKELLGSFSGGAYKKIDVSAILEYFKPLMDWLEKENREEYIGWKTYDAMYCPGDKDSTDSPATYTSHSYATVSRTKQFPSQTESATPVSTTKPSTPVSTTKPSTPVSTTNPSTPVSTTKQSTPVSTTNPSTPVSTTKPSTPVSTTKP